MDCRLGDVDGITDSRYEPSRRVIEAERRFLDVLYDDYVPFRCEEIPDRRQVIDVAQWVETNASEWMKEPPVRRWVEFR